MLDAGAGGATVGSGSLICAGRGGVPPAALTGTPAPGRIRPLSSSDKIVARTSTPYAKPLTREDEADDVMMRLPTEKDLVVRLGTSPETREHELAARHQAL